MVQGRIAVVDEGNRFLRWAERKEVHAAHLPHRSAHVLLFDSAGRLVLQRRHPEKLTYANYLDLSACGHVEESDYPAGPDERLDEVYRSVAGRELEEELGVRAELELLGRFAPEPGVHYEHLQLFRGVADGPYRLQVEEVSEVRALSRAELAALLADPKELVTDTLRHFAGWLLGPRGRWG
jgi:16S rRNA (adenine1518-N6/adenine1519-N6)-dimethyltransferase